jgi:hypothetical protein
MVVPRSSDVAGWWFLGEKSAVLLSRIVVLTCLDKVEGNRESPFRFETTGCPSFFGLSWCRDHQDTHDRAFGPPKKPSCRSPRTHYQPCRTKHGTAPQASFRPWNASGSDTCDTSDTTVFVLTDTTPTSVPRVRSHSSRPAHRVHPSPEAVSEAGRRSCGSSADKLNTISSSSRPLRLSPLPPPSILHAKDSPPTVHCLQRPSRPLCRLGGGQPPHQVVFFRRPSSTDPRRSRALVLALEVTRPARKETRVFRF